MSLADRVRAGLGLPLEPTTQPGQDDDAGQVQRGEHEQDLTDLRRQQDFEYVQERRVGAVGNLG
ncbi:MAG TPA: hypothetical protein VMA73_01555 [Streptosporangiaceae bacterium]|nr:hypothetical protein [Streptosporangiaceae bacterium]